MIEPERRRIRRERTWFQQTARQRTFLAEPAAAVQKAGVMARDAVAADDARPVSCQLMNEQFLRDDGLLRHAGHCFHKSSSSRGRMICLRPIVPDSFLKCIRVLSVIVMAPDRIGQITLTEAFRKPLRHFRDCPVMFFNALNFSFAFLIDPDMRGKFSFFRIHNCHLSRAAMNFV